MSLNWRRVLVFAIAASVVGVACSSDAGVIAFTEPEPEAIAVTEPEAEILDDGPDVERGIDVDWLTGTAWTVFLTSENPVDAEVTLSFSTDGGALMLDVFDECSASGALSALGEFNFSVEPLGGEDCLGATNLRELLVGNEGELMITSANDNLLITTETGLQVVAEHFQSTSQT